MMKRKWLYISLSLLILITIGILYVKKNNIRINNTHIESQSGGTYSYYIEPVVESWTKKNCNGVNAYEAELVFRSDILNVNHIEFDLNFDGTVYSVTPMNGWVNTYNPNNKEYSFTSNTVYSTVDDSEIEVSIGKMCFDVNNDETAFLLANSSISVVNTNSLYATNIAVANSGSISSLNSVEYNTKYYYKISLTSDSVMPTDSVTLTANIPEGLIIKDVDNGTISGRNITWNIGSIGVDETKEYIVEVQVDSSNMHNYTNTTLTETTTIQVGGLTPDTMDSIVTIKYPKLTANITANNSNVKRGSTYNYEVTINNTGGAKAYNVNITDVLPSGIKLVDSTQTTYTKNYATINSNESKTFNINVEVKDTAALGSLENSISVTSDNYKNVTASSTVNIVDSSLNLAVSQDKTTARIGENVTFTISVNNSGEAQSEANQIISTIPSNMELVSATGATVNGSTVTWSNSALNGGATVTKTLVVKVKNTANINSTINVPFTLKETGSADKTASKTVTVKDSIMALTNATTKNVFKPGETFDYTLTATNTGEIESRSIVIEDTIDSRLQIVSATGATISGNKVTWNAGVVAKNASKNLTIRVKVGDVANNTTLTSTAVLKETNRDDITTSKSVTIKKPIGTLSYKFYNTSMNKELNLVSVGEEFIYQITLKNTGEVTGNNITLSTTIDSNLTIVDSNNGTKNGNTITWTIDSINASGVVTKNVRVKVKENVSNGYNLLNTISASGDSISLTSNSNITVAEGDVYVIQTPSKEKVKAGDDITYTIKVGNRGNSAINNVVVVDTLPNEFELTSTNYPENLVTLASTVKTITIPELAANSEVTIQFIGKIKSTVSGNQNIVNSVQLSYEDVIVNNSNTAIVVESNVNISMILSVIKVLNEEVFNWTIILKNDGSGDATNLIVNDNYPEGIEIISCEDCERNGNTLTWQIDNLAANETKTIVINAKTINQEVGKKLPNSVVVKENGKDDKTASSVVEVTNYKVSLSQKASVSKAKNNDEFKYTITIKNNGTQLVNGSIIDYIDPSIEVINLDGAQLINDSVVYDFQLAPNEEKVLVIDVKVRKDAGRVEAINRILLLIDEEEYDTSESSITLEVDTVNPHTGASINYLIMIIGIVIASSVLLITNKKKRFFKI